MSATMITITDEGATIRDLLPLPAMTRPRAAKPTCPNCGNNYLRHRVNSRWHECKACRHSFIADCSKWKHGGNLGG